MVWSGPVGAGLRAPASADRVAAVAACSRVGVRDARAPRQVLPQPLTRAAIEFRPADDPRRLTSAGRYRWLRMPCEKHARFTVPATDSTTRKRYVCLIAHRN